MRFALLGEILRDAGPLGVSIADHLEQALEPLKHLYAEELIRLGTPFFWMNVHRCIEESTRGGGDLSSFSRHLLMTAFDAFFEQLDDGVEFALPGVEGSDVVLPRMGIRVATSGRDAVLRRLGPTSLEVEVRKQRFSLDLASVESTSKLPAGRVPGFDSARLLMVRDPALFEKEYIGKIAHEIPNALTLTEMISESLELIKASDAELGSRIAALVRWYVPLSTPDLRTHNSFTAANLMGVMFLSEAYNDIRLAEAIVHEFHHNELYMLMETQEILEHRAGEEFYSPWRDDPRPLYGLFHALHVFSGVIDFYARAETIPSLRQYIGQLRRQRSERYHQLRLGLAQVPDDRLSPLGRSIIESIKENLDWHEAELGPLDAESHAPEAAHHLKAWCERNPELAPRVRMP